MELDEIKKIIQDFFQENTVTIVGSGLSLAEGIPGMSELAAELQARIPALLSDPDDTAVWSKISTDLSSNIGLEQALHNTKPTPAIEERIRKATAQYIGHAETRILYNLVRGIGNCVSQITSLTLIYEMVMSLSRQITID